jgi:putative glutamine amidotransferase
MSVDGVVEALEPEDAGNSPFLMLVQWHPERMNDLQSTFSMNIKKEFLQAVRKSTEVEIKV